MSSQKEQELKARAEALACSGTGLCAESQADGVPCEEPGRDCLTCERAILPDKDPAGS
jgi:hypothetical protein